MSARRIERALGRLASGATLSPDSNGAFGVFVGNDRRRRPLVRLSAAEARALESDGAIKAGPEGGYVLTAAGAARVRRSGAAFEEQFLFQHAAIVDRAVMDGDGAARSVRGLDAHSLLRRLASMTDASGAPWLSACEIDAANRLRADFDASEIGLVRGSDWTAAPIGSGARGPGSAQEAAMARRCDGRRRLSEALERLAPPLRRVVERVCLHEDGLEVIERAERWPARSAKLALKLGLAQLAAGY
jgi:hypothetical protein